MMKVAALLLTIVAVIHAQGNCFKHWTRAEAGTSGGQTFTGIVNGTATEDYNNPLWYSVADAQTGLSVAAKGRFSGSLPTATFTGPMKFEFFKKRLLRRKDSLSITFTKSTGVGAITAGSGCYKGISAGTATRVQVGTTVPKVFEWTFCPNSAAKCSPK